VLGAAPRTVRHMPDMEQAHHRFAKWIRFYDAQIGAASDPWKFREGIEYLLRLWQGIAYFPHREVQIYTIHDQVSLASRVPTLKRQVIDPLTKIFRWPIELVAKERDFSAGDPRAILGNGVHHPSD
jgi:hypothetical protein